MFKPPRRAPLPAPLKVSAWLPLIPLACENSRVPVVTLTVVSAVRLTAPLQVLVSERFTKAPNWAVAPRPPRRRGLEAKVPPP